MFLKSMELFGFKSFADRTHIIFEPGITVIVGPNGCGKSNIVDSVKWVLGEKQAKNIRGEKMEDIIFTGTETRKPLSLSEVSLTIDNTGRLLRFDSDSVTVTRRVFRDGESEYLINKSPVRLKDIEELFLDTGIGKSAYSVMEQGKIDLILSTRAEDRRYIFEEAAGISRFKLQKKESLRKLQDTGANLDRINDIIREIEREKDLKAKQAETTKVYLALRGDLNDYDIKVNLLKFRELSRRQAKLTGDVERLKRERESLSTRVSTISAENEKDEKRKNDIQLLLFEEEKNLHTCRIKAEDIDDRTANNRKLIEDQRSLRDNHERKISERTENRNRLETERKKTEEAGVEIRKKISEDRERLASFSETRKRKTDSILRSREKIEENKRRIKEREGELVKLRDALEVVVRRLVDAIEKRKTELTDSEEERQKVRRRIEERLSRMEDILRDALKRMEAGEANASAALMREMDVDGLRADIARFESYEDGFRSILFDKTGVHAEKEKLDRDIRERMDGIENLRGEINDLEEYIRREQAELEDVITMTTRVEKDLSKNENDKEWIEKHLQDLDRQIADVDKQIESFRDEIARSESVIAGLRKEIEGWENSLVEYTQKSESLKKNIAGLAEKREDLEKKIVSRKNISRKDAEEMQKIVDRIGDQDRLLVEVNIKVSTIEEYLWTEYEKKPASMEGTALDENQFAELQRNMQEVKKKIQDLGPINNLAIEEYKDLKKRFEYYISQKKDIEKAREDILSVIVEINRTSVDMFLGTFVDIKKNFSEIFKQLFEGGNATIELTDEENILESGIDILVQPPGKKLKNINLLSGGERALTAIALLFATYMVKPSPFCYLDEIDAPLDEENIGRFVRMLQQFARSTQFIIISHNKKTMRIGESIYGITMEEAGVSKVVSLKMEKKVV